MKVNLKIEWKGEKLADSEIEEQLRKLAKMLAAQADIMEAGHQGDHHQDGPRILLKWQPLLLGKSKPFPTVSLAVQPEENDE